MIEKYFEVVSELRERGFAVAVLDWRGQGGSARALPIRAKGMSAILPSISSISTPS